MDCKTRPTHNSTDYRSLLQNQQNKYNCAICNFMYGLVSSEGHLFKSLNRLCYFVMDKTAFQLKSWEHQ